MTQPDPSSKPVSPAIIVALLFSAVMLVVLGTILPGMMELPEPGGLIMRLVLYAAAAGDVAIALWFRSRMKKTRAATGGTIQRQ
jgi:hypothetical protein